MRKVKVCGITRKEDAFLAVKLGVKYLGFNFYEKSPRIILPKEAEKIINKLPLDVKCVGVFVNEKIDTVLNIVKQCNLSIVQLHGDESPQHCLDLKKDITDVKIIKAFRIKDEFKLEDLLRYKVDYYLLDSFSVSEYGGTGKVFNWNLALKVKEAGKVLFLSGGLNAENVKEAIIKVDPDVLDVASGIESSPGCKDAQKMTKFMEAVKRLGINDKNKNKF